MGLSAAVLVNALVLQPTRHPAPLFAAPPSAPVALPREAPAAPPERPRDVAVSAPAQAPAAAPAPAANSTRIVAKEAPKDPLGDFIRASNTSPDQEARIMQVQRALARAGSPGIKADGIMGTSSRQAIEKFERDHKWPVTGEISPRLLRELGITGTVARP